MALTEFPAVSCKQRLRAARRLAAGDPLVLAAVYADMTPEELDRLQFDPDFTDLIDACRALHALDHAAWRARIELLMRDSVEDALQENKVSTLNTLLRGAEREQAEPEEDDPDEDDAPPPPPPYAEADPARETARQRALGRMGPMLRGLFADDPLDTLAATFPHYARPAKAPRPKAAPPAETEAPAPAEPPASSPVAAEPAADAGPESPPAEPEPTPAAAPAASAAPPPEAPADAAPAVPTPAASDVRALWPEPVPPGADLRGRRLPPTPNPGSKEALDLMRARLARLLDRTAERVPQEGDLADAVCAVLIPRWPYTGLIDLADLQTVLAERPLDQATVAWLASDGFPFTRTLRGLARPRGLPQVAQGP